jgi:hypothetical protein
MTTFDPNNPGTWNLANGGAHYNFRQAGYEPVVKHVYADNVTTSTGNVVPADYFKRHLLASNPTLDPTSMGTDWGSEVTMPNRDQNRVVVSHRGYVHRNDVITDPVSGGISVRRGAKIHVIDEHHSGHDYTRGIGDYNQPWGQTVPRGYIGRA